MYQVFILHTSKMHTLLLVSTYTMRMQDFNYLATNSSHFYQYLHILKTYYIFHTFFRRNLENKLGLINEAENLLAFCAVGESKTYLRQLYNLK